jgi:hypothetical protein
MVKHANRIGTSQQSLQPAMYASPKHNVWHVKGATISQKHAVPLIEYRWQ